MQDIGNQQMTQSRVQSGHIYISPPPPKPTLAEVYVYDPLDHIATAFLKFSFVLLALAVLSDMVSGG